MGRSEDLNRVLKLNDGNLIPILGLGTWLSEPGEVRTAVEHALRGGYTHVDCAAIYFNEKVSHFIIDCFFILYINVCLRKLVKVSNCLEYQERRCL